MSGESIQMKMAKASKGDIDKCVKFFQFVDEFMEDGTQTPYSDEIEEESIDLTDEEFVKRLRTIWGGRFKHPGVDCSWSRVVFGCDMLIDNVCDPNEDTLEWKPELAAVLAANAETITWRPISEPPDEGLSVLIKDPTASEPVWPGYVDDSKWFHSSGSLVSPTHWADMPRGPQ